MFAVERRYRDDAPAADAALLMPLIEATAILGEPGAHAHMNSVGAIAETIALAAGWCSDQAAELRLLAALHDVGKLAICRAILMKPGRLTTRERAVIERHASIGRQLLSGSSIPLVQLAARVAGEHHEWSNGGGYPHGLARDEIHPSSRVIAIADVFDALTSPRPYRPAMDATSALEVMMQGRATQFDPDLFDAFVSACFAHEAECAA